MLVAFLSLAGSNRPAIPSSEPERPVLHGYDAVKDRPRPLRFVREAFTYPVLAARHRALVWNFWRRDLHGRFRGSALGIFWVLVHPLCLFLTYYLVFGIMFQARMMGGHEMQYPLYLFLGVIAWTAFADTTISSTAAVSSNGNLIQKVAFPAQLLPLHTVAINAVVFLIGCVVHLVIAAITGFPLPGWQLLLLPAAVVALLAAMPGTLAEGAVVTDDGSTKQDVVTAARAHLGAALPRFVPAHPIAGTEQSGARAAFAALFEGRHAVLTPLPETDATALARVRTLWEACGADVVTLDAPTHDRILGAVSHLPHFLAAAYVAELAARPESGALFRLAGSGFRDFTRIAAASPAMWHDIGLAHRDALRHEIAAFRGALARFPHLFLKT